MNLNEEFLHYDYSLTNKSWQLSLPSFTRKTSEILSQKPKVSIIIANYNNAPYLRKMLESLVNQTLSAEHIQIMFLDDKSTDESVKIVESYIEKYPSIELYAQVFLTMTKSSMNILSRQLKSNFLKSILL